MLEPETSAQDFSASLAEPLAANVPWHIVELRVLPDYQLFVRFIDGVAGKVEMREQIFSERAGVFASLRDPAVFADVGLDFGAVSWANGLDIAPDATHDDIQRYGVQILR